jgi:hypothetical protein
MGLFSPVGCHHLLCTVPFTKEESNIMQGKRKHSLTRDFMWSQSLAMEGSIEACYGATRKEGGTWSN